MSETKKPWIKFEHGRLEVNPVITDEANSVVINIGCDFNVEVDKLYGPLAAELIRVRLEYKTAEWVVEREHVETGKWEEKARWDCQESWPEDEESNPGQKETTATVEGSQQDAGHIQDQENV